MITEFQNEYRWLSNFEPCIVILDGVKYQYAENAYQAAKTLDLEERNKFVNISPGKAKRLGKTLEIRKDWDKVKFFIMQDLQKQKYSQEKFKNLLLSTGTQEIQEGNNWNDTYWGISLKTGKGKNMLGKIIMEIRSDIQIYGNCHDGCEVFDFDLDRMKKALEGPTYRWPKGLELTVENMISVFDDINKIEE